MIEFKINCSDYKTLFNNLLDTDSDFEPNLSKKVDLSTFAIKMIKNSVRFEAWNEGKLIGIVACYFNDLLNLRGFITHVSVTKEHKGMGISKELLKMCINYGEAKGYRYIDLEVDKKNNIAYQLYKKVGFNEYEVKLESVIMRLNIN